MHTEKMHNEEEKVAFLTLQKMLPKANVSGFAPVDGKVENVKALEVKGRIVEIWYEKRRDNQVLEWLLPLGTIIHKTYWEAYKELCKKKNQNTTTS